LIALAERPIAADTSYVPDLISVISAEIEYAFQPIVNVHSGDAYGFEALLRRHERVGAASIAELFEWIAKAGVVLAAELVLREKAVAAFVSFAGPSSARLFFNLNHRIVREAAYHPDLTLAIFDRHGLAPERVCFEISEMEPLDERPFITLIDRWTRRPTLALDDFGRGFSGLKRLIDAKPSIVKVDRFFIAGVERDDRRRSFLGQLVALAQSTGAEVVAEGVETESELRICREAGCDYIQGYYVARPTTELGALRKTYAIVEETNRRHHVRRHADTAGRHPQLDRPRALEIGEPMSALLEAFRSDRTRTYFPVVDAAGAPLGIVHEEGLKSLIYSPFGRTLLTNSARTYRIEQFLSRAPVFDAETPVERILSALALHPEERTVMISQDGYYAGLIDARSMLRTMHDRMLATARDQNPLTKLPGNMSVANHLLGALESAVRPQVFVLFDFDNFKPFNDHFGFHVGDRAIAMFVALLRARLGHADVFLGHIGGDDFFLGAGGPSSLDVLSAIPEIVAQFASDAESFYDARTRAAKGVRGTDRDGSVRTFPLLSVSCGCAVLTETSGSLTIDELSALIAALKGRAKRTPSKIAIDYVAATPAANAS